MAHRNWPCFKNEKLSRQRDEKVVNPPRKPIMMIFCVVNEGDIPQINPIKKEPVRLIKKVGKKDVR